MPAIVYSKNYDIGFYGLERLHPFDSKKYSRAWRKIKKHFGRRTSQFWKSPSRQANQKELCLVHQRDYLSKLKNPKYLARALEVDPLRYLPGWVTHWHVLNPMRWATRGTICAAEECLTHGLAINLSGGYHHAKPDHGEGFSIYSDIAIAIRSLRDHGHLREKERVLYIDTDAHQGNGVCHVFQNDSTVFIFDIYNEDIYPMLDSEAKERIDCNVPVSIGCQDEIYLSTLESLLPPFLDSVANQRIGLAIYNAGTDVVAGDRLGLMNLSSEAVLARDKFVVGELRKRNIATTMVLSGGYTKQSFQLVADSVIELVEKELS